MKRLIVLALVLVASAGVYVLSAEPVSAERERPLPVAQAEVKETASFLAAAAKELGYSRLRAYPHGVFIEIEDGHVSFFNAKQGFVLSVGFDTRYRLSKKELGPVLDNLEARGRKIFERALELRAAASTVVQTSTAAAPRG